MMTQVQAIANGRGKAVNPLVSQESSDLDCSIGTPVEPYYANDYVLDLEHGQDNGVRELAKKVFGDHISVDDRLEISQLKGGITNMLLQGKYIRGQHQYDFLVRAYGHGTSTIIDRDREFATHLSLHNLNLAPPLYSRFANGLLYGFIPGKATHYTDLSDVEIMRAVSNRLAEWHAKLDRKTIQDSITEMKTVSSQSTAHKFPKDLWSLLDKWLATCPPNVLSASNEELRQELEWIKEKIGGIGNEVVGHCDLLSGNILVPSDWTKKPEQSLTYTVENSKEYVPSTLATFIDYEYAMPVPRGFDLANHFMEWQGFDCIVELIPSPSKDTKVLRYWCFHYLSAFKQYSGDRTKSVTEDDIDSLIDEIIAWWGMPGYYWGIWAAIQSTISEIDFDYATYAQARLDEYFAWKTKLYPTMNFR